MDLWIRSQDKEKLINITNISLEETDTSILSYAEEKNNNEERPYLLSGDGTILGFYATKERALEVLDEIQNAILGIICLEDIEEQEIKKYTGNAILSKKSNNIVYEMPKE